MNLLRECQRLCHQMRGQHLSPLWTVSAARVARANAPSEAVFECELTARIPKAQPATRRIKTLVDLARLRRILGEPKVVLTLFGKRPMVTKAGDVIILHQQQAHSMYAVGQTRDDGDRAVGDPQIFAERGAAMKRARGLVIPGRRIFLVEGIDDWAEIRN